ncbi:MAG: nuclear transport factor 2 family protein [Halioglobus sp.]
MTLEQRLSNLEAVEAIRKLKARYFHACDTKQPERVRECFATGEIDLRYGRIGSYTDREELVAVFSELACHDHIVEMHHGQNPQIEIVDENNATAIWGLYYYLIDTRQNTVTQLAGFYDDAYTRVGGEWTMNKSWYEVCSTQIFDLSEGLAKVIFAGGAAPSELDDPSKQAG